MRVYFVDANKRYIGNRELKDGEAIPVNATTTPVTLTEGKEAHFVDGAWVITDIIVDDIPTIEALPTIEEQLEIQDGTIGEVLEVLLPAIMI